MKDRYIAPLLQEFAAQKFVLINGPRQVGKTTVAQKWLGERGLYANWDIDTDRELILSKEFQSNEAGRHQKIVFDEIHRYDRWKNFLKGLYDKHHAHTQVVVTGSCRLEVFKKSGDSMMGRYESLQLHPFSVAEITKTGIGIDKNSPPEDWETLTETDPLNSLIKEAWSTLEKRSGFPEPFSKDNTLHYNRWSRRRREILIKEDLREISDIKTISLVEKVALLLPMKIMSPLSLNSLRNDVNVHHETITNWINALDNLYFSFRIGPYDRNIARSVRKEQKLYLWDWAQIKDPAGRFENMVASHLLKAVQYWKDVGYGDYELKYWRDVDGHEIDFIITQDTHPVAAIECKLKSKEMDKSFLKFKQFFPTVPCFQLMNDFETNFSSNGVAFLGAASFLKQLV